MMRTVMETGMLTGLVRIPMDIAGRCSSPMDVTPTMTLAAMRLSTSAQTFLVSEDLSLRAVQTCARYDVQPHLQKTSYALRGALV